MLVSGRSGTGKTTIGLLRLAWQIRSHFDLIHGITSEQIYEMLYNTEAGNGNNVNVANGTNNAVNSSATNANMNASAISSSFPVRQAASSQTGGGAPKATSTTAATSAAPNRVSAIAIAGTTQTAPATIAATPTADDEESTRSTEHTTDHAYEYREEQEPLQEVKKEETEVKQEESNFRSMFLAASPRLCDEAFHFMTRLLETFPELRRKAANQNTAHNLSPWASLPFNPPSFLAMAQFLQFVDQTLTHPFIDTTESESVSKNTPSDRWTPEQWGSNAGMRVGSLAKLGLVLQEEGKSSDNAVLTMLDYERFKWELLPVLMKKPSVKKVAEDLPHCSLVWRSIMSFIKVKKYK